MKTNKIYIGIVFLLFLQGNINASEKRNADRQPVQDSYAFSNIGIKEGLSQQSVMKLYQDSYGYIWFGTRNGLNRFDGYETIIYKRDNNHQQTSLTDNHITSIAEDGDHNLWIGTAHGLNILNLHNNKMISFNGKEYPELEEGVRFIYICSNERCFIGTPKGLYLFDKKQNIFKETILQNKLKNVSVNCIAETASHQIIIGTNSLGLLVCSNDLKNYQEYLSTANISHINANTGNIIWVTTYNEGLYSLDISQSILHNYNTSNSILTTNNIRTTVWLDNLLFIGTAEGLYKMNTKINQISYTNSKSSWGNRLNKSPIFSLLTDKDGGLWIGTFSDGVFYYNKYNNRFHFHNPLNHKDVYVGTYGQIVSLGSNRLLVAAEGAGLLDYDTYTHQYTLHKIPPLPQKKERNIIKSLSISGNYVWCGTSEGRILYFNTISGKFVHYINLPVSMSIYAIYHQSNGSMWVIGSKNEYGLINISQDKQITWKFPVKGYDNGISFGSARCIYPLSAHTLLIGTTSNGLYRYDTLNHELMQYATHQKGRRHLNSDYITSISSDPSGNIWISTYGGGLCQYDDQKGIIKTVTVNDGLSTNEINSLVIDSEGTLWLSSNNCITRYSPKNNLINNFSTTLIDVQEFTLHSGALLSNNDICFGMSNGFITLHPKEFEINKVLPKIVLNSIAVNNKWIKPEEGTILKNTLNDTKVIELKHFQNNIIIRYSALSYFNPKFNQYAYRLLGQSKEWNYVNNRHEAYFTNLHPSNYIFQVKASNNDGVWNDEFRELVIIIHPPLWFTWYAWVFYILLFSSICFTIIYYAYKKRVMEQAMAFKQKEHQQREQFHQDKLQMYTNFSHELRTPLSLIISPLDDLKKHENLNQDVKNKLQLVYNNAQRLLLLVDQLMDIRKGEAGHLHIQVTCADIYSYINEIFRSFRYMAEERGIKFTYNQENGHLLAWFDKFLFEKVLFNILSNAFKNTPSGGHIHLHCKNFENDQNNYDYNKIQITINDNGQGVPADEIKHIFEPFYQSNKNRRNAELSGTGIGLSLTRTIVALHHGTINASNNTEGGMTFNIVMPIGKNAFKPEEILDETDSANLSTDVITSFIPQNTINIKKCHTVLLVEDNDDVRQYVRDQLIPYYYVEEAVNGVDALNKVTENMPDIVISDIMMPQKDGLELCRDLKENMLTVHIPVILITAKSLAIHVIEGYSTGADDYIIKPFNVEILIHRINNILQSRKKLKDIYGKYLYPKALDNNNVGNNQDQFVQKFYDIIEQNLSNPELNVDFICREIGVSRTKLYSKLHSSTDLSPIEIIRNKRMECAIKMLRDTDLPILDIAIATGFNGNAYFSTCFKNMFGCSPSDFLKKYRNQDL